MNVYKRVFVEMYLHLFERNGASLNIYCADSVKLHNYNSNTKIKATIKPFIRTSTKEKKLVNEQFRLTDGRDIQLFQKSEIKVMPNDFDAKNEKIKAKIIFDTKLRKSIDDSITDRKMKISNLFLPAPDKSAITSDWLEDVPDRVLIPEKYISEEPAKPIEKTLLSHVADFISKAPEKKLKMCQ